MTQVNVSVEQKTNSQAQRIGCSCHSEWGGERWTRRLGSADVNYYLQGEYIARSYCIEQGSIFNTL